MEKNIKQRILILGSSGMLGHVVLQKFLQQKNYETHDVSYRKKARNNSIICDIIETDKLVDTIKQIKPDVIINCIGVLIKGSEKNSANAIYVNSYFPHLLVKISNEHNIKIIHISTDCVFSGKKGLYSENDMRDSDDTYGKSKALGEIFSPPHLTLRTSIIGPEIKLHGEGLFHWFINQQGTLNGFTESYWSGITTLELAKKIELAIANKLTGLMHVTNGQKISKFELLNLFKDIWKKNDVIINKVPGKKIDKSLLKSKKFNFSVPGYIEMLEKQKKWMIKYNHLYKHYNY